MTLPAPLRHLCVETSDDDSGVVTLDAMGSCPAADASACAALRAEVQRVLAWAQRRFPHSRGPAEEGGDWDIDLQERLEDGGRWQTVHLCISASARFAEAFAAAFPPDDAD